MTQIIKSRINIWLLLILILFLLTRIYKISEIPPSVYWDEASIGYNAYSIAKTLKDEWGDLMPLHFRAFGEFKLPIYIYSVVPFIKLFGLNEFSVRIPSVLFSFGVVILTFFLARKLTGRESIGLWSSFFISISPWFFIFSRTGYEATAGLMFYLLGIYLFFRAKNFFYFLAVLSFILSAYSYNSFRIISPLTLFLLFWEWKNIKIGMRWLTLSIIVIIISVIPIYRLYVYDTGISRLQNIGRASGIIFLENYLSHFDPRFLFLQGDNNLRHQQRGFGQLYVPEILLLLAGLIYLFKYKTKYKWLPVIFILLAPIPSAITKESPHALRAISTVPFICMLSAMGAFFINWIPASAGMTRWVMNFAIVIIFVGLFINYFVNFLTAYPYQAAKDWQYDYKRIFTNPKLQSETKDKIYISDEGGQPYIFALFYLKYNPEKFRMEVVRNSVDKWGFSTVARFGKFEFGNE